MVRIGKSTVVVLCCVVLGFFASCSDNEMDYDVGFTDGSWIGCAKSDEVTIDTSEYAATGLSEGEGSSYYAMEESFVIPSYATSVTVKVTCNGRNSDGKLTIPAYLYFGDSTKHLQIYQSSSYASPSNGVTTTIDADGVSTDGYAIMYDDEYDEDSDSRSGDTDEETELFSSIDFTIYDIINTYGCKLRLFVKTYSEIECTLDYKVSYTY